MRSQWALPGIATHKDQHNMFGYLEYENSYYIDPFISTRWQTELFSYQHVILHVMLERQDACSRSTLWATFVRIWVFSFSASNKKAGFWTNGNCMDCDKFGMKQFQTMHLCAV